MANEYKNVTADKKREAKSLMTDKQIKEVNIAIHTAAVAAGAGGIIPIPVMDSIPISAAQVTMVVALGKIFDQKVTDSAAKGIIGAAASTLVGRSLVKLIPVAGWIASAAVAAGVTEAIGWTIAVDFAKASNSHTEVEPNEAMNENTTKEESQPADDAPDDNIAKADCDTDVSPTTDYEKVVDATNDEQKTVDHVVSAKELLDAIVNEKMKKAETFTPDDLESCEEDAVDFTSSDDGCSVDKQSPIKEQDEDPDDESVANDFSKAFGEEK